MTTIVVQECHWEEAPQESGEKGRKNQKIKKYRKQFMRRVFLKRESLSSRSESLNSWEERRGGELLPSNQLSPISYFDFSDII